MGRDSKLGRLWCDEQAVTSTEYALLLAVVSLSAVLTFGQFSDQVIRVANTASAQLRRASGIGCAPIGASAVR